ncbi:protein SPMIP1 [Pyxicephalus adspersus]|uniref:Sperm microtubule inner protein 1 C-terminal domain-containing protein n=1 Tax=Pyxicephalus adspersus TaxID=30357 RepID=A0AAV3AX02_PYXAD|nr:TPA: hypothetical protein GDO54_007300 [Pyxicephalus adspersus]DBA31453.1 TPA: hypothetical protein GDO54_007300 [Pyxicephalus adspersus]
MAREFNLTTQKQEFLRECYLKEILTRFNWRRRYGQNLPCFENKKQKIVMTKNTVSFKLPAITDAVIHDRMDQKRSEKIHRKKQSPKERNQIEPTCFTDNLMRPASPRTRNLLYSGTSKEEQGRYQYMKARNNLRPENKYTYPLVSSWEYGWQMGNASNSNGSPYRRCRIVNDTFFRKNGIPCQPHPKDMAL